MMGKAAVSPAKRARSNGTGSDAATALSEGDGAEAGSDEDDDLEDLFGDEDDAEIPPLPDVATDRKDSLPDES